MSSVLELLSEHLGDEKIASIAQRIDADPGMTRQAIQAAVPTLLAAMAKHSEKDGGAEHLHQVLANHPATTNVQGLVGLGPLSEILGGKQKKLEGGIGQATGLDVSKVGPLLEILGPIVLASLRNKQQSEGFNPADLSGYLRKERENLDQRTGGSNPGAPSLLGRLLDKDGDGDFDVQDLIKIGWETLFGKRRN